MLGKIYIVDSLLYGMKRIIYTHYNGFSSVTDGLSEGRGCGRTVTCTFRRRFIDLHLLGDIVSLISTAPYIGCPQS